MIKSTGIVRKVDELGRICLPSETRNVLGIGCKDPLEVYTDGERIVLKKHVPGCIFCGAIEGLRMFKGKKVCWECAAVIKA